MTNILHSEYSHPGIRTADSDNASQANGYMPSTGTYNSMLLQPARSFFATIAFDLEPSETSTAK